jgi:hypothetical protein
MASGQDAGLDDLLGLVKDICTKDQVQSLLRAAKQSEGQRSSVRIAGKLDDIVSHNLRDAIQAGKIAREAVYSLVSEAEESGRQHIFYFVPKDERVKDACNDSPRVASRLFGGPNWKVERNFPNYHLKSSGFEWADFRTVPTASPDLEGWVVKAYAGVTRQKHVGTRPEPPNRIAKIFEEIPSRDVYLARWHPFGLLELRLPLEKRQRVLLASVRALWAAISAAVSSDDFEPYDLTPACRRIIDRYADHSDVYRLGDAHLLDSGGGTTKISARRGEEHLMEVEDRRKATEIFEQCRLLVVVWLLNQASHDTGDQLRTVVGGSRPNEVAMVSRTTAKAVDHVTHRLHQFTR